MEEAVNSLGASSLRMFDKEVEIDAGDSLLKNLAVFKRSNEPWVVDIKLEVAADFADLFEVKDALSKKGECYRQMRAKRLVFGHSVPAARLASHPSLPCLPTYNPILNRRTERFPGCEIERAA